MTNALPSAVDAGGPTTAASTPRATGLEPGAPSSTLLVVVDRAGRILGEQHPLSDDEFLALARSIAAAHPEIRSVIAADGRVEYAGVVHVIDLLRQAGITRFALQVEPR